ncbi:hypothetical protein BGW42_004809 [Actinomortierella wolfii]|nr:hypothetical protein BGW42_004809 [Actinomortierella wolfii]
MSQYSYQDSHLSRPSLCSDRGSGYKEIYAGQPWCRAAFSNSRIECTTNDASSSPANHYENTTTGCTPSNPLRLHFKTAISPNGQDENSTSSPASTSGRSNTSSLNQVPDATKEKLPPIYYYEFSQEEIEVLEELEDDDK